MYLIHCTEMFGDNDKIVERKLLDVILFLEKCRISESYVVQIVHLHNENRITNIEQTENNPRYERIKVHLSPTDVGARVDL